MKPRTEEEWRKLHENVICSVIAGRYANVQYSEWSESSMAYDAIRMADTLVERLKEEEMEATTEL